MGLSIRADGPTGTLTAALQAALTPKHKDNPKGLMCLSASDSVQRPRHCEAWVSTEVLNECRDLSLRGGHNFKSWPSQGRVGAEFEISWVSVL